MVILSAVTHSLHSTVVVLVIGKGMEVLSPVTHVEWLSRTEGFVVFRIKLLFDDVICAEIQCLCLLVEHHRLKRLVMDI